MAGTYLEKGAAIASIGVETRKRLKVSVDQKDMQDSELDSNSDLRVWTSTATWKAAFARIDPRATLQPPHESLCSTGNGSLTVQRGSDGKVLLGRPRVNAFIDLKQDTSAQLFTGQRVTIVFGASSRTLGNWLLGLLARTN